ncbi:Uncharacterised protein [Moraxella caprae]|uniref:Uncharacterized protein n=2 Tax=Moraxella caprae TaxID=90240 RepID=A0A378R071_9GAMM|nr:Uncharacterised protein [Moraxella caprae]
MMIFKLELYQLITLALTIGGTLWGVGKAFFNRVETSIKEKDETLAKALSSLGEKLDKESEAIRQLDREILKLKAELPREYVSKDDFIRSFTVVEAKIDAVQTTLTHLHNKEK